jgi:outer membrane lipoprotein LolB
MYRFPLVRGIALLACLLLAACAPVRVREAPAAAAAQETRESRLAPRAQWSLNARIGISNGNDGGSGDLVWRQDGDNYTFTLQAVNGRVWKLSGDAHSATLEGVDAQPDVDTDPQRLLHDRLGWDVPLNGLRAWIRGLRAATAHADVIYDAENLPAVITQLGWKVEYRDWFGDRDPALPRKVFASRGNARVRVAIQSWNFDG